MNKKVVLSVLSTAVVASMAASAFAAPKTGLYIGGNVKKFYSNDTLINMTKDARATYKNELKTIGFKNLVYVNFKGQGATIQEMIDLGVKVAMADPLKQSDFSDLYSVVNNDGTISGTEDARSKVDPTTPGEVKIDSVTANNLKTITVNLNAALDSVSTATVKLYNAAGTDLQITPELSADGKSVYFVGTFAQDTTYKVKFIDAVYQTSKKFNAEQTVTVKDITSPEVSSVKAPTSKALEVSFSEPVDLSGWNTGYALRSAIKVDGVAQVADFTFDNKTSKLTLKLGTALTAGAHNVEVGQFTDFAGFKSSTKSFSVTVGSDTAAPEVTAVEVVRNNQIKVTFNEPVAQADLGTLTVDNGNTTTWVSATADNKTHTFNLNTALTLASVVEAKLSYVGTKDAEGNAVTTAKSFTFKAADDTTKATASVTVSDTNAVVISYSEPMSLSGTVVVKDQNGVTKKTLVNPAFKDATNKVVELTALALGLNNLDSATYTIEITGAKDYSIRSNESDKITASFTLGDNKPPTVDGVVLTDAANGKVTLYFSEAMDAASVSNKDNYMIDLTGNGYVLLSTITGGAVAASADLKTAVLTIPNATTNTKLKVLGLKDASGKITSDFNQEKTVSGVSTFNHNNITSVTATAVNKLEVVSNTPFGAVSPSTFVVIDGSTNADALVATNAQLDSTKTKLTLTLNGNLTPSGKLANGNTPKLATVSGDTLTTNSQGGALTIAKANAENITETIKPVLTTVAAGNTIDNNATIESNQFTITFSEPIAIDGNTDEALLLTDLVIKDGANKLVSASDLNVLATDAANANEIDGAKSVVIEVAAGIVDPGSQTFSVAIPAPRNIKDASGNVVEEATAKNVTISVVAIPNAPTATLAVGTAAGKTTVSNVDTTMEYKVGNGNWTPVTNTSFEVAVNKGDEIKVRVAAVNGVPAGTEQTLTVDYANIKEAAAPIGVALAQATQSGKTKLTGVAATQEYKVGNGSWTDITGTEEDNITANAGDTILVRVKQTATQPPSAEASVTVTAGNITP